MKLTKFRIKNYKSIVDSGDCFPAEMVTILAGKNESGKSSILEALSDFNVNEKISEKAIRIEDDQTRPEIEVTFKVGRIEIDQILEKSRILYKKTVPDSIDLTFTKRYPDKYDLDGDFLNELPSDIDADFLQKIKNQIDSLVTDIVQDSFRSAGRPFPTLSADDLIQFRKNFNQWKLEIHPHLGAIAQSLGSVTLQKDIDDLDASLQIIPLEEGEKSIRIRFFEEAMSLIPNFILFNSFNDIFPNAVPLADLSNNSWVKDLQKISTLDIAVIQGQNARQKVTHKQLINAEINENFKDFWTQDLTRLVFDFDNTNLFFWIEENGFHYEPEIRSQGKRWHLAFYIKVSARAKDGASNVILIDEPGLYLHANAQRDILKNIDECSKSSQIFFSTHSPYLIEPDKLERVRLVEKQSENQGTKIENKIHRFADAETLTPILTAIGLELNRGIVSIDKISNVIVEGISDYYYLNAFKNILYRDRLNFIHGGSSGNMPKIGMILQGWGCDVLYLYDNDRAFKDAQANIKKEWIAISKSLLSKIPVDGAIEDMFSKHDFCRYVLEAPESDGETKNSDFVKKLDKVLKAKNFKEKIASGEKYEFDETTLGNFSKLFDELEELMPEHQKES